MSLRSMGVTKVVLSSFMIWWVRSSPVVLQVADPLRVTLGVFQVGQHGREVDHAQHDGVRQAVEQVEERELTWDDLERHDPGSPSTAAWPRDRTGREPEVSTR